MAHLYALTTGKHGHASFAAKWANLKREADGFAAHFPNAGWTQAQGNQIANLYNMVVELATMVNDERSRQNPEPRQR